MGVWNPQANEVFLRVVEIPRAPDRLKYLDEACGADAALRAQVESLLAASERAGGFLESPAPGLESVPAPLPAATRAGEGPGTVIGRYKLLEQIGEGGMGVVFLAEQTRPVRRLVAVKVIKAGMDTKQVIARFEAERQALALMDHPNIAKVYDAGATESGRPYFVMELVKGVPITKYCDEHRLSPRERLGLFVQVCQAVQHAHQKGVIHRDLKPSNVPVALYDGKPVPKVIDFGVAKATGGRLTEQTLFTGFGAVVGTPEYMSPEQAELNQLDVDTRSDIYSLGVLLYELLTGTTPVDRGRLKERALLEVLRVVREEEPPRPSTRLSTVAGLPEIAASRGLDAKRLSGTLRGDLDLIVMKALEKDRARRYETANGFARDIERYLSDEPVQACPPSTLYRFRKFARRRKSTLATAALLAFVLLAAVGTTAGSIGWAARDRAARQAVIERETDVALEEAETWCRRDELPEALAAVRRAEAYLSGGAGNEALRGRARRWRADLDMLTRLEQIRLGQSNVKGERFDHAAADPAYVTAFREYGLDVTALDPAAAATRVRGSAIAEQLVAALDDWAWVKPAADAAGRERLRTVAGLADPDDWRNCFRDPALQKERSALEELAARPEVDALPPTTTVLLARALRAVKADDKALRVLRRALDRHPGDFWLHYETGATYGGMVDAAGKNTAAMREAISSFRAALACRPNSPPAYSNLAWWLSRQGDQEDAMLLSRQSLRLDPDHFPGHFVLGIALCRIGSHRQALAALERAVELQPDHYWAHCNLANACRQTGDVDRAVREYREAIRLTPRDPHAHRELGVLLKQKKMWAEAAEAFIKALRLNPADVDARSQLVTVLAHQDLLDQAIAHARKVVQAMPQNALARDQLARLLQRKGLLEEAIVEHKAAVRLAPRDPRFRNNLGAALRSKGLLGESLAQYQEAVRLRMDSALPGAKAP